MSDTAQSVQSQKARNKKAEEADTAKSEETDISTATEDKTVETVEALKDALEEMKDKYLRLYAEFENYKKKTLKDKDDLVRYTNESLIYELLIVLDNLEMALKHATEGGTDVLGALIKGVENTLRELNRVLEKNGLKAIDALDKTFDPAFHHAMAQIEKADVQGNTVIEEFRKGYLYREKVIRPSLVAVSKEPQENKS
ncbi:MAG: nucleotide exchange factor GrpE [Dissulfurispiraceae bacterium]